MSRLGGFEPAPRGIPGKRKQQRKLRTLIVEALEARTLLSADLGASPFLQFLSRDVHLDVSDNIQRIDTPQFDFTGELTEEVREGRQLAEPTHHYFADGQPQGMVIYPDRIALGLKDDMVGPFNPQWMEPFGLTESRSLAGPGNFSVYVSAGPISEELISSLADTGWVESVVPVFQVVETQSEAVLLNEVIVKLPDGVQPQEYFADSRFSGFTPLAGTPDQYVATLTAGYGEEALAEINRMTRDPDLTWAVPNFHQAWQRNFIPNDPRWANLWHLENTGQSSPGPNAVPGLPGTDINVTEAWDIKQGSNSTVVVGVLDDGVPAPFLAGITDHPDLLNYVGDENYGSGPDTNGNGWIGDRHGWDFVNNGFISWPGAAEDRHGTAVAGLAAAVGDNGVGVVGPAYNSPVISARMFAGTSVATDAGIASALYYLAGRTFDGLGQWDSATVVNHSWGGGANSTAINEALTWATTQARGGLGVTQFFSSGNTGGAVGYPASQAAVNPGIIVVGAINNAGELTNYHNRGALLDIVAPSNDFRVGPGNEQIYLRVDTTDRRGTAGYAAGDYTGTGATGFGGTSASAPIAAGVAGLALSRAEDLSIDITAAEMRRLIRNNTQLAGGVGYSTTNNGRSFDGGFGLIDAGSLVSGIGNVQMSVHTSFAEISDGSSGWTFGEVFVGSITEGVIRIRSQGTETLDITNVSVSGDPGFSVTQVNQDSLGIGDATTFVITFNPLTAGPQSTTVTIASNDPNSPVFTFEVEAEALAPEAYGFVFEDRNGDGIRQPGENPLAGRTVFADTNANGVIDTFDTQSFVNDIPLVIPDVASTVISTIDVSGLTDFVTDVNVRLNITHTWIGDLAIFLESPTGELSLLVNQRGGSGDDMIDTVFDDGAALSIAEGTPPFTGNFRPETPLSVFNGLSAAEANGEWNLIILDLFDEDGGTLNEWELTISTGEFSTVTDSFGFYAVDGLGSGNFDIRLADDPNWTAAPGATTSHPISLPNPLFADLDLGIGRNNRFYAQVFDDVNGNGVFDPGELGRADRTLFIDGNGNGILDGLVQSDWTDSPGTAFGGEPQEPPDFPTPESIVATQDVSGLVGILQDINVKLNITHAWINDIRITLIAPDSSEVLLFNRRGGNGQNLIDTVFDDDADVSITTATAADAPFTGSWRPEQPLSLLDGIDPNGTWGLRVEDLFPPEDDGVLDSWTLTITTSPDTPFDTGPDGWAAIDLEDGTYDILLTDVGFSFTLPTDGKRVVTAAGLPLFNQTYGEREAMADASIVDSFVYHGGYTGIGSPIDTGKVLAVEGASPQTLTFDNLINTSRGINGLVFDIENLPGSLAASDFEFQVSPTGPFNESLNPPSGWDAGPSPSSITVTPGSPDRVLIEWPDNSIMNRWLRVTVLANASTGLPTPEVFYIGHLLGETTGASGGVFTVQFFDITPIRAAVGSPADASSILDIDKNGNVAFADISAMRPNIGTQLTVITIPGAGPLQLSTPGSGGNSRGGSKSDNGSRNIAAPPIGSELLLGSLIQPDLLSSSGSGRISSQLPDRLTSGVNPSESFSRSGIDQINSDLILAQLSTGRSSDREELIESVDRIFDELGRGELLDNTLRGEL